MDLATEYQGFKYHHNGRFSFNFNIIQIISKIIIKILNLNKLKKFKINL